MASSASLKNEILLNSEIETSRKKMIRSTNCLLPLVLHVLVSPMGYSQVPLEKSSPLSTQLNQEQSILHKPLRVIEDVNQPRIGDPGWSFDESSFDPRFPEMREWAKAGVEGGVPLRCSSKIKLILSVGSDIQTAIDQVASEGGGVIQLDPGEHWIDDTIKLKSGVILRGSSKDLSTLKIRIKAPFFKIANGQPKTAIEVNQQERVGVEDLTIQYASVDFEPIDRSSFNDPWDRRVFHEDDTRDKELFVNTLIFTKSRNCWVDNCIILCSGAHPIGLSACQHMTMRNNFIDRAYVKKDSMHGGYYGIWGSRNCLFYNETVSRIRHFALMLPGCCYNVIYQCNLEVDLNFHDADDGQNLIEKSRLATPVWHSWDAVAIGAQGKHRPPGPRNFLFDNFAVSKGVLGYHRRGPLSEKGKIYQITTEFNKPVVQVLDDETPPKADTLYAVMHDSQRKARYNSANESNP